MNEETMKYLIGQFTGDNKITHEFFGVNNTTHEYKNGEYSLRNQQEKNNNSYRNVEVDPMFIDKYLATFSNKERDRLAESLKDQNTREETTKNFREAIIAKHVEYLKDPYKVGEELGQAMKQAIDKDEDERLKKVFGAVRTSANEVRQVLANNSVAFGGDDRTQQAQLTNLTQRHISGITPT